MKCLISLLLLLLSVNLFAVDVDDTRLLQQPAMSSTMTAFVYDNDIWLADLNGQNARRVTRAEGVESFPHFSPDGKVLAFSARYDGNLDVYIMPITGGAPKRLTWHPADDVVQGFTRNGHVVFHSQREVYTTKFTNLYAVSINGGMPEKLPIPNGCDADFSPDGKTIVYLPGPSDIGDMLRQWKNYRGGTTSRIWKMSLTNYQVEEIPQPAGHCNDLNPMWIGDKIYFVSDRNGEFNLYSYDLILRKVFQLTEYKDFPIFNANAGGGKIIFEQAGRLVIFDPKNDQSEVLKVAVGADLRERRPRFVNDKKYVRYVSPSPKAKRVVLEYRGEIVTVPAEKGEAKNLTNSTGAHDRSPQWSPDGSKIAWVSDKSGEYKLYIQKQDGSGARQEISLTGNGFYTSLRWSPDGKYMSYWDNSQSVYILHLEKPECLKIDQEPVYSPGASYYSSWSPDSKYLAYTINLNGLFQTVKIYSLIDNKSYQISDGMSNVSNPVFDADGKYLYMLGSTDAGPIRDWFSQWNYDMDLTCAVYTVVLDKNAPSPVEPESDEVEIEEKDENKDDKEKKESIKVKIDYDNILDRIVALPVPEATMHSLQAGKKGEIYFIKTTGRKGLQSFSGKGELQKFTLEKREVETLIDGVDHFIVDYSGEQIVYKKGDNWAIAETGGKIEEGKDIIPIDKVSVYIEPEAEWSQIAREACRINRDYFYADNYHGANWEAMWNKYEPFLQHAATRADVERIISMMAGELCVGHSYSSEGETIENPQSVSVGLLGADYKIENGRYRFHKIYGGINLRPDVRSPLTTPGVNLLEGDYLLQVEGNEIKAEDNIYKFFQNCAEKQIHITVSKSANGEESRTVIVVPVSNEQSLRWIDWVENNIKKVDRATNGRVAYVHVPDTGESGHTYFKRYFYPQSHKEAIIIDERYNRGGLIADYYIDILSRDFIAYWHMRYGQDLISPRGAILGPKVMIIDENAGSGGDLLPWMFRKFNLGPLVGKRTWGGLVGILGFPILMDGGYITAPNLAIWTKDGWVVENEGVAPDIEVEQWPRDVNEGKDPQLQKAIEVVLKMLDDNPPEKLQRPEFPVRVR